MKKKKKKKKEKRKLMVWIEVYGGQRSLAFELTTVKLASRARPLFKNVEILPAKYWGNEASASRVYSQST